MTRRLLIGAAIFSLVFAWLYAAVPTQATTDVSSPWFRPGDPTLAKVGELPAGTSPESGTIRKQIDCRQQKIISKPGNFFSDLGVPIGQKEESEQKCVVDTKYGAVSSSGLLIRLGTLLGGEIKKANGSRFPILPIPNSSTAASLESTGNNNGTSFVQFLPNFEQEISTLPYTAQNGALVHKLKSSANPIGPTIDGKPLEVDSGSVAFSKNGEWMVADSPPFGPVRVNVATREVLRLEPSFSYYYSLPFAPQSAISSDGRYVFISSYNTAIFKIYDLKQCTQGGVRASTICPSRDLRPFLLSQPYGLQAGSYIRFSDQNNVTFYGARVLDNQVLFTQYAMTAPGESLTNFGYLALGDSFASGEGTFSYKAGTDVKTPLNKCHLSLQSYPFLLGSSLRLDSYQSVACSGAKMHDMDGYGFTLDRFNRVISQSKGKPDLTFNEEIYDNFLPGYRPQRDFVSRYKPGVITVSVLGNDIGFSSIIKRCVLTPTCYGSSTERADKVNEINSKFSQLVQTFAGIKQEAPPGAKIYVLGYPQLAKKDGSCGVNVHANSQELEFFDNLVHYLNFVIQRAAQNAKVEYANIEDALVGSRLCEADSSQIAVNGLTAGNDGFLDIGPVGKESFHPNAKAHELYKNTIARETANFTKNTVSTSAAILPDPTPLDAAVLIGDLALLSKLRPYYLPVLQEDLSPDFVYKDQQIQSSLDNLQPGSELKAWLYSEPVLLANTLADSSGSAVLDLRIPPSTPPGLHTIHIFGRSVAGEPLDIYKDIYVAASAQDYDGDGILNELEKCLAVEPANVDYDQDGIDDACDPVIGEAPPPQPSPLPAPPPAPIPDPLPADDIIEVVPIDLPSFGTLPNKESQSAGETVAGNEQMAPITDEQPKATETPAATLIQTASASPQTSARPASIIQSPVALAEPPQILGASISTAPTSSPATSQSFSDDQPLANNKPQPKTEPHIPYYFLAIFCLAILAGLWQYTLRWRKS